MTQIYITKSATTQGVSLRRIAQGPDSRGCIQADRAVGGSTYFRSSEWSGDTQGAIARVGELVAAERARIARRLARLDAIDEMLARGELPMAEEGGR